LMMISSLSAAPTMISAARLRSCSLNMANSPMVPSASRPFTPILPKYDTRSLSPVSSRSPLRMNGVGIAG
jgi:hypothetical protein